MQTDTLEVKVHRIYKMQKDGPLKAFADIVINDAIVIKGIKLLDGKQGLFVSMPQEKAKDNKWYDSVRCLSKDLERKIESEVLAAYEG